MNEMLSYVIMILLLSFAIWFDQRGSIKYNKNIGNIGENIVATQLGKLNEEYTVENDVRIGHSQIDHLVINHSLKICYVIETKYWAGKITGKRNDKYWQQENKGTIKFYLNPILQNECHCREIRKSYIGYHVNCIVVFVRNKNVPRLRCIVSENEVINYIKQTSNKINNITVSQD